MSNFRSLLVAATIPLLYLIPSPAYCLPLWRLSIEETSSILQRAFNNIDARVAKGVPSLWLDLEPALPSNWEVVTFGESAYHVSQGQGNPTRKSTLYFMAVYQCELQQLLSGPLAWRADPSVPVSVKQPDAHKPLLDRRQQDKSKADPASSGWLKGFMALKILSAGAVGSAILAGCGRMGYKKWKETKHRDGTAGKKETANAEEGLDQDREDGMLASEGEARDTEAGAGEKRPSKRKGIEESWRRFKSFMLFLVKKAK